VVKDSGDTTCSRADRDNAASIGPVEHEIDRSRELTEAFRINRKAIYTLARRICGGDAAADVTQEVFLRAWKWPDRFDAARGSIRQYLLVLARGVSIDHLRRETAGRARELRAVRSDRSRSSDGSLQILDAESATRLASALAALTDSEREAIVSAFFGDASYREVASRLGIPEGTVKSRIRLGLRKLRVELRDLFDESDPAEASS